MRGVTALGLSQAFSTRTHFKPHCPAVHRGFLESFKNAINDSDQNRRRKMMRVSSREAASSTAGIEKTISELLAQASHEHTLPDDFR